MFVSSQAYCIAILSCIHAATVVLNSSVGVRGVCPGEMVTYTCTVIQGIGLDWIVEPFISGSTCIRFVLGSTPLGRRVDCNGVSPTQCDNIDFVATFTNTANPMTVMNTNVTDITSTLTITATASLNGRVVQCRGSTASGNPMNSSSLNITGDSMLLPVFGSLFLATLDNINFMATLTNTANLMTVFNIPVANITSTMTFTATPRQNGTVVQCRGSTAVTQIANRTVNVAGRVNCAWLVHITCNFCYKLVA